MRVEPTALVKVVIGCNLLLPLGYWISRRLSEKQFTPMIAIVAVVLGLAGVVLDGAPKDKDTIPTGPTSSTGPPLTDSAVQAIETGVVEALTRADVHIGAGNFAVADTILLEAREDLEEFRGHPSIEALADRLAACHQSSRRHVRKGCNPSM